jgi:hypothetical protein
MGRVCIDVQFEISTEDWVGMEGVVEDIHRLIEVRVMEILQKAVREVDEKVR